MENTSTSSTPQKRPRKLSLIRKVAAVRNSAVVLFGGKTDPDVQASARKIEATGRKVIFQEEPNRPGHE